MNVSKEIGYRIGQLRNQKGEKQIDLAKALGVKRETVTMWENGNRDIKTEHTVALADHFGVTCDYILRGVKSENVEIYKTFGLNDKALAALEYLKARNYTDQVCELLSSTVLPEMLNSFHQYKEAVQELNKLLAALELFESKMQEIGAIDINSMPHKGEERSRLSVRINELKKEVKVALFSISENSTTIAKRMLMED